VQQQTTSNIIIWSWYTGRWWMLLHLVQREGAGWGCSPPRPSSLCQM